MMKSKKVTLDLPLSSRLFGCIVSALIAAVIVLMILNPALMREINQEAPFFVVPLGVIGFIFFMIFVLPPCLFGHYPVWMLNFIPRSWFVLYSQSLLDYYKTAKRSTLSGETLSEYLEELDREYERQISLLNKK